MLRRRLPRLTILSTADQVVSSSSNFIVGIAAGRAGGAEELGGYMVAFTLWLIVVGVHRALITEPMVINHFDPRDHRALRDGIGSELALGGVGAALLAVVGVTLVGFGADNAGASVLMLAAVLPLLLGQDFWRAMFFADNRPDRALVNDVVFTAVQLILLGVCIATDRTSAPYFVAAWGLGAGVGLVLGHLQVRMRPSFAASVAMLRAVSGSSRWLLAEFSTKILSLHAYSLIVATMVSETDYGGYRAALSLLGPSTVILLSGGNVGLPGTARHFREGGYEALHRYSRQLTMIVGGVLWSLSLLLLIGAGPLLRFLYGEEFGEYAYLGRFAAIDLAIGVLTFGPGIGARVANHTRQLWMARMVTSVLVIATVAVLTSSFGLVGAGVSGVVSSTLSVIAVYWVYVPMVRRGLASERHTVTSAVVALDHGDDEPTRETDEAGLESTRRLSQ